MQLKKGGSLILDMLRGTAAQLVLIGHAMSYFGVLGFLHPPNLPWMQNIAVVIFFVLSGFVITRSVSIRLSRNEHSTAQHSTAQHNYIFSDYFIDRFARIYGGFLPALLLVALVDALSFAFNSTEYRYTSAFTVQTFLANVLMLQNFPILRYFSECCTSFGSGRPFWTLAVEWWIYMAFGYFFIVLNQQMTLYRVIIFSFLAIVPLYNLIGGSGNGLLMVWAFGSVSYLLFNSLKPPFGSLGIKWLLLLASIVCGYLRAWLTGMEAYDPIVAFCIAVFILTAVMIANSYSFASSMQSFCRTLAGFSYTLYLVHYPILDVISTHFHETNRYLLFILGFIVSNIVSFYLAKIIEGWFTETLRRLAFASRGWCRKNFL